MWPQSSIIHKGDEHAYQSTNNATNCASCNTSHHLVSILRLNAERY